MDESSGNEGRQGIVDTAMDYYEGWFDGDATRMKRALHPQLVKRALNNDAIELDTAAEMIDATAAGIGRSRDPGDRRIEVRVDHIHGSIATATVTSAVYVDFLQLVKVDDRWQILNALWARA